MDNEVSASDAARKFPLVPQASSATRRSPHKLGKPCPKQPWMSVSTLDIERGKCGACGAKL